VLATTPAWTDFGGYVSALALADLDLDGAPDLAGGIWFGGSQIYLNGPAGLPASPAWYSAVNGTVEALFFGDVDRDGLVVSLGEQHAANGGRTYYLRHAPAHQVLLVSVDGLPLAPQNYCVDLEDGWIALDRTPLVQVAVTYRWSRSLDMGVTNWDGNIGNQVYLHLPVAPIPPLTSGNLHAAGPAGHVNIKLP